MKIEDRVEKLILRIAEMRGVNKDDLNFGAAICLKCRQGISAEGQSAAAALGTARGMYFKCNKPCKCGGSTGFVEFTND